jgi:hypothetical protein
MKLYEASPLIMRTLQEHRARLITQLEVICSLRYEIARLTNVKANRSYRAVLWFVFAEEKARVLNIHSCR